MQTHEGSQRNLTATQPLSGSIFAVTGSEVELKQHWKRRLVIKVYPLLLLLTDILVITLLFSFMLWLKNDISFFQSLSRRVLLAIMLPSLAGVYLIGGYNYATDKKCSRFISEHIITSIGVGLAVFCIVYSFISYGGKLQSSRVVVAGVLLAFPLVSIVYRLILSKIQAGFEKGNAICILGAGSRGRDMYRRLKARNLAHEVIVISFLPKRVGEPLFPEDPNSPLVESADQVSFGSSIRGKYVETYIIAAELDNIPAEFSRRMVSALFNRHKVFTYETYISDTLQMEPPTQLSVNWPMLDGFRLNRKVSYDRVKRLSDIAAALIGFILASPFLIGTAILVKLTSAGPVIFKQERTGLREKPFMILKFRSMRVGSEKGAKYTAINDDRFTPIGKFIRKTRLDELPQLWNVLVGDLSLIGPRAEWVDLVRGYEERLPFYHFRHAVKPGITGWAQVNYSYGANDEDTKEKLNYDLYYVRRYSLTLDVAIVVKTFYMMLFGKGM